MRVLIAYAPDHAFSAIPDWPTGEFVEGEPESANRVRITSFGGAVPLAPGDVVTVETVDGVDTLTGIAELAPVWVFEVDASVPKMMRAPGLDNPDNWVVDSFDDSNWEAARLLADEVEVALGRATAVQRSTNHSITLATESREWFDRFVETNPHVTSYTVLREPGQDMDLDHALRDAGASLGHLPMFDKHGVRLNS